MWRRRPFSTAICLACAIGLLALIAGFVVFACRLPASEPQIAEDADGVVALTGDDLRVEDALALLAQGRGQRLLITGVNPTTTAKEIAAANPRFRYLFQCCVDLGYEGINTLGNAVETRDWARRQGYSRSLIVVTSTYHMPRALAEMAAAMPGMKLVPYPVEARELSGAHWWAKAHGLRLLGREYVKYLFAVARVALAPPEP